MPSVLLNNLSVACLLLILVIAARLDIKSRRIPNGLILTGLATSICTQILFGGQGFSSWSLGLLTGFGLFFPLYLLRAMGAGDVKLMAVVGSFVGPAATVGIVLATFVAGGFLAIVIVMRNRSAGKLVENLRMMTTTATVDLMTKKMPRVEMPAQSAGTLPYGVAIAAGTMSYLFYFHTHA